MSAPEPTTTTTRGAHHDHDHAHVLIVGAGLAGLALAQGLKKRGIRFTVFERDETPELERRISPHLRHSLVLGPTEPAVAAAFAASSPRQLAETLTAEWDDAARCLVELQDDSFAAALRIVSATPDIVDWAPSPFVTLVGDAIHIMSPSGGVGAATALKDAVALVKAITGPRGIGLDAIRDYETTMRAAARGAIERSFRGGEMLFGQPPLERCRVLADVLLALLHKGESQSHSPLLLQAFFDATYRVLRAEIAGLSAIQRRGFAGTIQQARDYAGLLRRAVEEAAVSGKFGI